MKRFHKEEGKDVVYVQLQDVVFIINQTEISIPASIAEKVFSRTLIIDDTNRFDFVKFEEEAEVKFFENLNFVVDYDKYKDLGRRELKKERKKLIKTTNKMIQEWNKMTIQMRKENIYLLEEIERTEYVVNCLQEIYGIKTGKNPMNLPEFVK